MRFSASINWMKGGFYLSGLSQPLRINSGTNVIISDIGRVIVDFTPQNEKEDFCDRCSVSREEVENFFSHGPGFQEYERRINHTEKFFEIVRQKLGFTGSIDEFKLTFGGGFSLKRDVFSYYFHEIKPRYDIEFWLLSNINELHHEEIHRSWPGISYNCTKEFLSYQLGCRKPDSEIYEVVVAALRERGFGAHQCVFVDDLEENVVAARRAGILSSIRFENLDQLKAAFAAFGIKT